jgi:hypothetical protein
MHSREIPPGNPIEIALIQARTANPYFNVSGTPTSR